MIIDQTYKNANWGQYCRNIFAVIRGTVNYVYLFYLHMWRTMNLYSRNSQICSIKTNLLDDKSVSHFCDYILANIDISISQFATKKFLQYWSLAGVYDDEKEEDRCIWEIKRHLLRIGVSRKIDNNCGSQIFETSAAAAIKRNYNFLTEIISLLGT